MTIEIPIFNLSKRLSQLSKFSVLLKGNIYLVRFVVETFQRWFKYEAARRMRKTIDLPNPTKSAFLSVCLSVCVGKGEKGAYLAQPLI
jgi:hypothetical protein